MRTFWLLALVASVLLGTGCNPVYRTEYSLTPPPTEEGKMCSNSCLSQRSLCYDRCSTKETECRYTQKLEAGLIYLQYVSEQKRQKLPVEKDLTDFIDYSACRTGCTPLCESTHRVCHVNCGGNVLEHRYCAAHCD